MFYGGESNVPGAPGNLLAGGPSFDIRRGAGALGGRSGEQLRRLYEGGTQQNQQLNEELMKRGIMPGSGPQLPMAFGSSNLPGAVGNMGGLANAQFFEGPQLGQAAPQGEPQRPYGGAPNVPLTPEEKARLLQQGSPIPPNFREQYLPRTGVDLAGNQGPSTPVKFDEHMNMLVPNMGAGRPGQVRFKLPQAELPGGFQAKYVS